MKKLIALTFVQMEINGKLGEVQPGQPLVLSDEKQIAQLVDVKAVREPTAEELKTLFSEDTPTSNGGEVGVADLSKLSKAELLSHAEDNGILVDPSATKADILAAIESNEAL